MAAKKLKWSKVLLNLVFVIPSLFNILRQAVSCIEYEAALAKKSLITLIILSLLSAALLTSAWVCLCAMAYVWLISWPLSPLAALSIILTAHIVMLLSICIIMLKIKENVLFPRTRKLLRLNSD